MQNKIKKILAVLLVATMTTGLFSMPVMATESADITQQESVSNTAGENDDETAINSEEKDSSDQEENTTVFDNPSNEDGVPTTLFGVCEEVADNREVCEFDLSLLTSAATTYTVSVDGDDLVEGTDYSLSETENKLLIKMDADDHELIVNGQVFKAWWIDASTWNNSSNSGENNETIESKFVVTDTNQTSVYFYAEDANDTIIDSKDIKLEVSDYKIKSDIYKSTVTITKDNQSVPVKCYEVLLNKATGTGTSATGGKYTYTIDSNGYYSSTCGFTVASNDTLSYSYAWTNTQLQSVGMDDWLDSSNRIFAVELDKFVQSPNAGAWDGKTIDVSWFDGSATKGNKYYISTPAQLAGLAAIVNGIVNDEIETVIDTNGVTCSWDEYVAKDNGKIKVGCSSGDSTGPRGMNMVTSNDYYYNKLGFDFDGQYVYLTANLDMGGYLDSSNNWTGARYMPIGGQYQMYYARNGYSETAASVTTYIEGADRSNARMGIADGSSHLGSSFNGTFDGAGHIVENIYCDRYSLTNYGDSSTIGLIGRLGIHDNDYNQWKTNVAAGKDGNDGGNYPPTNPTVCNVAVSGYIYGRRSVGGIVGKTGHTSLADLGDGSTGAIVQNCVNFATVHNTDAKGVGGIIGAAWNGGITYNCINFGYIYSTYGDPTGGIVGYNENSIVNCYNAGLVKNYANDTRFAEGISSNNGGSYYLKNNYYLEGNSAAGGYYNTPSSSEKPVAIATATDMQNADFLNKMNKSGKSFANAESNDSIYKLLNNGNADGFKYSSVNSPVPRVFLSNDATISELYVKESLAKTDLTSEGYDYTYHIYQPFEPTGLEVWAKYSDGTEYLVEEYTAKIDGEDVSTPVVFGKVKGEHTITLNYECEGKSIDVSYTVNLVERELDSTSTKFKLSQDLTFTGYNERDALGGTKDQTTSTKAVVKIQLPFVSETNTTAVTCTYDTTTNKYVFTDTSGEQYNIELKIMKEGCDASTATIDDVDTTINPTNLTPEADGRKVGFVFKDFYGYTGILVSNKTLSVMPYAYKPKKNNNGQFEIENANQLSWVTFQVNNGIDRNFASTSKLTSAPECSMILVNDIVCGDEFSPIGTSSNYPFIGTFDGNGHSITFNYEIPSGTTARAGLFGYVNTCTAVPETQIKDLTVKGSLTVYSSGQLDIGGVAGSAEGGSTFENCTNEININCTNTGTYVLSAGGIVGEYKTAGNGQILNCVNKGNINAQGTASSFGDVGGIVGLLVGHNIKNCVNDGKISTNFKKTATYNASSSSGTGGIVGFSKNDSKEITNCINNGDVLAVFNASAAAFAGGIIGANYNGTSLMTTCQSCANHATITIDAGTQTTSKASAGGIIGKTNQINMLNCYNSGNVQGANSTKQFGIGGIVGSIAVDNAYVIIKNVYNSGTVSNSVTDSYHQCGSLIGYQYYYGKKQTLSNMYALEGTSTYSVGGRGNTTLTALSTDFVSGEDLTNKASALGIEFKSSCAGYPILSYESDSSHELVKHNAVDSTCTENGRKAYWTCSICNKLFENEECTTETTLNDLVIESTGHNYVCHEAVEPTYDTVGNVKYYECTKCHAQYSDEVGVQGEGEDQFIIPKLQHKEVETVSSDDQELKSDTKLVNAINNAKDTHKVKCYYNVKDVTTKNVNSKYGVTLKDSSYIKGKTYTVHAASDVLETVEVECTTDGELNVEFNNQHEYVAVLEAITYTVKFNTNGGGTIDDVVVNAGNTVAKPANPSKSNYNFVGWYTDENCTTAYDFDSQVTGDLTLYALYSFNAKYTASLTLNDNIDINFKLKNVSDDFDISKLIISVDGDAINSEDITQSGTTVSCVAATIAPKDMAKVINIVVTYDGVNVKEINYSVRKYCETVFNTPSYGEDSKLGKLCKTVLNYGAWADQYFNKKSTSDINEGYVTDLTDVVIPEPVASGFTKSDVVTKATAALVLNSSVSLKFKIYTTKELTKDDFAIVNNLGQTVDADNVTVTHETGYYVIVVSNISSSKLSRNYTLTIKDINKDIFSITYGAYSYCNVIQKQTGAAFTDTLKTLCKALYSYGEAAKEYEQ